MSYLTLGQAAKEAAVSKSTISKALKSGRLSYVSKDSAGYQIDPAELFRVFPKKLPSTDHSERSQTPVETANSRELELLRARVADLEADRDAWREQARQLALMAPQSQPGPQPKRRWFGRG